jgi:hypothetical protein
MPRHFSFVGALVLMFAIGQSLAGPFSGEWGARACEGQKPDYCGGFYLKLTQLGDRICGDHYAATPGLGRLNEGDLSTFRATALQRAEDKNFRFQGRQKVCKFNPSDSAPLPTCQ